MLNGCKCCLKLRWGHFDTPPLPWTTHNFWTRRPIAEKNIWAFRGRRALSEKSYTCRVKLKFSWWNSDLKSDLGYPRKSPGPFHDMTDSTSRMGWNCRIRVTETGFAFRKPNLLSGRLFPFDFCFWISETVFKMVQNTSATAYTCCSFSEHKRTR